MNSLCLFHRTNSLLFFKSPPSPPTMRSYRAPISVSRLDQTRPSAQFLAPTLRGARPNPSGIEQQLDIHIAILSPQSRPGTAANLSQAMTDLSLNLHNQAQLIAARTQEISNRVNAVSQLNQSLSSAIQSLQSANNESIANTTISSEERTLNPTENETDLCALDDLSISAVTENAPISLIPEQALADHMDAHAQHMAPIDESQPAPVSDTPSAAIISNTEGQNEIGGDQSTPSHDNSI